MMTILLLIKERGCKLPIFKLKKQMKNLKHIHNKCSDILEMIDNAQIMVQHHTDQIQRLKTAGLDYKHQLRRLVVNAEIIERLKSYYLNQILKLTK